MLPCPTTNPVGTATAQIIPFPTRRRESANAETVAAVLLALEEAPMFRPLVLAVRGMDGVHYVGASVGAHAFRLNPTEARMVGDCLWADPGLLAAGFAEIAQRFRTAADNADRRLTQDRRA